MTTADPIWNGPNEAATTGQREHFLGFSLGVGHQFQRGLLRAAGRLHLFYGDTDGDGEECVWHVSSTDEGATWSSPTLVRDMGDFEGNSGVTSCDFHVDGDQLHVVYAGMAGEWPAESTLYYRRGTLETDGTITWAGAEQAVVTWAGSILEVSICTDSDAVPWITCERFRDETPTPWTIKAEDASGTWTTASGFPFELSEHVSHWWTGIARLNDDGAMIAFYWHDLYGGAGGDPTIFARVWNGSSWDSEIPVDEDPTCQRYDLNGSGRNFSTAFVTDPSTARAWIAWSDSFGLADWVWQLDGVGDESWVPGAYASTLAMGLDDDEGEPFLALGGDGIFDSDGVRLWRFDGVTTWSPDEDFNDTSVFSGALQTIKTGAPAVVYQQDTGGPRDPIWTVAFGEAGDPDPDPDPEPSALHVCVGGEWVPAVRRVCVGGVWV